MPENAKNTVKPLPAAKTAPKTKAPEARPQAGAPKKGGLSKIFVAIVLLVIAVLCFVPFFLSSETEPSVSEVATTASLSGSESRENGSNIVIDEGALQRPVPPGIDADTPEATTSKSVVITGDELSRIEENFSKNPPVTETQNAPAKAEAAGSASAESLGTLQRADSAVRTGSDTESKAQAEPAQNAAKPVPEQAKAAPEKASPVKEAAPAPAKAPVKEEPRTQVRAEQNAPQGQLRTGDNSSRPSTEVKAPATQREKSVVSSGVVRAENVPFTGEAIPGGSSEIALKNAAHYTVQVVAGSNRANIIEVSAGLSGRYWIYETLREGAPWYVLIVGEYPSREAALDAARQLPAYVKGAAPFAKSFGTVKQEMAAVNR